MSGYIFVLSNPLYQDFVLIGASVKTPTERAAELYTEGLLYPFKVEKAKQVATLEGKLVVLHKLIGKMGERPNPDRDFFKVSTDVVEHLFDLIDADKLNKYIKKFMKNLTSKVFRTFNASNLF